MKSAGLGGRPIKEAMTSKCIGKTYHYLQIDIYDCIPLPLTLNKYHVNMQRNYVNMQIVYVNVQQIFFNM